MKSTADSQDLNVPQADAQGCVQCSHTVFPLGRETQSLIRTWGTDPTRSQVLPGPRSNGARFFPGEPAWSRGSRCVELREPAPGVDLALRLPVGGYHKVLSELGQLREVEVVTRSAAEEA
jgi:hypothetical protein